MTHRILRENGTYLANMEKLSFAEQTNVGEDLKFGSAAASTLEFNVFGSQDEAITQDERLVYSQIDNNGNETAIGVFYANPTIPNKGRYRVTAYDAIGKLEKDFSARLEELQDAFPMDVRTLVTFACEFAGVELLPTTDWPFSDYIVEAFTLEGVTCRQILSWAAEIGGRFLRCTPDGYIYFAWYEANNNYLVTHNAGETDGKAHVYYKQDGLDYDNYETAAIDAVSVVIATGEDSGVAYQYPTEPEGDNIFYVKGNYLINTADERVAAIAQYLYGVLSAFPAYRPMSVRLFPFANPLRAGDIVSFKDIQGVSFVSPIMKMTVTDGYALAESFGHETLPAADSYLAQAMQAVAKRFESRITGKVESELAGVIANTQTLIEQTESQIMTSVQEDYYSKDETDEKIGEASTTVSQDAQKLVLEFVNSLQSQIDDNKEDADSEFEKLHSYIIAEGGTLTFKTDNSEVSLVIENDRIGIYENGTLVTYWTNTEQVAPQSLSVPLGGRFTLGNFAFIPRSNGSLDFRWIGD